MIYSCISDVGLIRDKNEDSYLAISNKYDDFLAIVADGIGGGKAGEVASSEVIKYFNDTFVESGEFETIDNAIDYIKYHIGKVNKIVFDKASSNSEYYGMGTTLTGILITKKGIITFNCGDSRTYGILDKKIYKLTTDHNVVNQMLEKGEITYEESLNHPKRHYLTKAIGIFEKTKFDVFKVKEMDYYLVCSDGLHGYVSDDEIYSIVSNEDKNINEKTSELKDLALLKGGFDNITIILIKR